MDINKKMMNGGMCICCLYDIRLPEIKRYANLYGNTKGGYYFVLWSSYFGHSGQLRRSAAGHLCRSGYHILPYISVGINVRPLKLIIYLIHKTVFQRGHYLWPMLMLGEMSHFLVEMITQNLRGRFS